MDKGHRRSRSGRGRGFERYAVIDLDCFHTPLMSLILDWTHSSKVPGSSEGAFTAVALHLNQTLLGVSSQAQVGETWSSKSRRPSSPARLSRTKIAGGNAEIDEAKNCRAGRGVCICQQEFTDYNDVVPDHKNPKGMGGAWRDDSPDNIQAVHWWCNEEKGSTRMDG